MEPTISLCMIAKDEEKSIGKAIDSVKDIVDEIIVVDTGSADRTKEVALAGGAKVIDVRWADDFSAARNESLKSATKDWILVLDADEVLAGGGCEKIKGAVSGAGGTVGGFALEQRTYVAKAEEGARKNPGPFPDPGEYPFFVPHSLVRLFRNRQGFSFRHRVHELVEDSIRENGKTIKALGCAIHHFSAERGKESTEKKAAYYISLIGKQAAEQPDNPRYAYQMARAFLGQGNPEEARRWFAKTAALDPRYRLVHSELAKIHLKKGEMGEAKECFRKSMELHPDNPSPANNLAAIHLSMGEYAEAKRILEEALKKHPGHKILEHHYQEALRVLKQKVGA